MQLYGKAWNWGTDTEHDLYRKYVGKAWERWCYKIEGF